jgi:hypothetical protein
VIGPSVAASDGAAGWGGEAVALRTRVARTAAIALAFVGVVVGPTAATASADTSPAPVTPDPLCWTPGRKPITADVHLTHDVDCGAAAIVFDSSATIDLAGHSLRTAFISVNGVGSSNGPTLDATFTSGRLAITAGSLPNVDLGQLSLLTLVHVDVTTDVKLWDGAVSVDRSIVGGSVELGGLGPASAGVHVTGSLVLGDVSSEGGQLQVDHDTVFGSVGGDDAGRGLRVSVDDNIVIGGIGLSTIDAFAHDVFGAVSRNIVFASKYNAINLGEVVDFGAITIDHNLAIGSKGTGIGITQATGVNPVQPPDAGPITITGNLAVGNQGHGIDAEWPPVGPSEIVDGGGNRAFLNHTQPQCIGVACRGLF